jgi:hypothetical protein
LTLNRALYNLFNVVHDIYLKNLLTALNLVQLVSEEQFMNLQMTDLKEDNEVLRHHNEALSENLQRSTHEYDLMASHLDGLRLSNLFRAIGGLLSARKQESFLRIQLRSASFS